MIELILPWPPSLNHYKKVGRIVMTKNKKLYQQRVNTNETKLFYWQVWSVVKKIMPVEGFRYALDSTIELEVEVYLHPPLKYPKKYDADNFFKVLGDSLTNAKVWDDDSQVHCLLLRKCVPIEQGQVRVIIKELSQ